MPQKEAGTGAKAKAGTAVKNKAVYKRLRNPACRPRNRRGSRTAAPRLRARRQASAARASSFANLKVPRLQRKAKKAGIKAGQP